MSLQKGGRVEQVQIRIAPGEPITTFCASRSLPVEARLRLFATVCPAVQHAHDKGVIHLAKER